MQNTQKHKQPSLDERHYIGREADERELIRVIEILNAQKTAGAIAICGSPGCGKTTFTEFLTYRIQTGFYDTNFYAERIDLDWFSVASPERMHPINPNAYLSFFTNLEEIFLRHTNAEDRLQYSRIAQNKTIQSSIEESVNEADFPELLESLKYLLLEHLFPLASCIKTDLMIFVDELDLIPSNQQHLFIEIFGKLTARDNNLRVAFSSRPVTSAIVRYCFRDVLRKAVAHDFALQDLDVANVLLQRGAGEVGRLLSGVCIDYLKKICCGNIDTALSYWNSIIIQNDRFETVSKLREFLFTRDKLPDIAVKVFDGDRVPFHFILLHLLPIPKRVNEKFYTDFIGFSENTRGRVFHGLNQEKIDEIVYQAIEMYFVRRIEFNSVESARRTYKSPTNVRGTTISLTQRGLVLLQDYNSVRRFSRWAGTYPTGVQEKLFENSTNYSLYDFLPENPYMQSQNR